MIPRSPARLAAVIATTLILGVVVGVIWAFITPAMQGSVISGGEAIIPGSQFPEEFAGVGVFALALFVYGIVAALVSWFGARSWRGPLGFAVVAVTAFVGSFVAKFVGTWVADARFADPKSLPVGSTFHVVPDLWLDGGVRSGAGGEWMLFLCAPLAVSLIYLVCALLSRHADLGVGDLPGVPDERLFTAPA